MSEKPRNHIDNSTRLAIIALCGVLGGGCDEYCEQCGAEEATMPFINDGSVSTCPVNLDCAEGKNFETGLKDCIDFSRCDPPMEK